MLKRHEEKFAIRTARSRDIARLESLRRAVLPPAQVPSPGLRELLNGKSAVVLVAVEQDRIAGYAVVLFRRTTSIARLHAIAVDPAARGRGIGRALLSAAEAEARNRGDLFMRAELAPDCRAAIKLLTSLGYRPFDRHLGYCAANGTAGRYEKALIETAPRTRRDVPFYHQTTNFTCGPCALMMGMAGLGSNAPLSRELEFQLWREATSIYLISAPGGCDPIGMAVTAARRGFPTEVFVNQPGPYFTQVRQGAQRLDVMTEAQRIFARQARELGIPINQHALETQTLIAALDRGALAIVLISTHRMYGDRTPHWMVIYDHDGDFFFAHDPWVGLDDHETPLQKAGIAISMREFERMSVWGKVRLKAALILAPPGDG